jgi:hypothetical protein
MKPMKNSGLRAIGNFLRFDLGNSSIDLMKREAVFLGKAEQLDYPTFHAARRRLQRQATLTTFTLWPFWPHNFVATN